MRMMVCMCNYFHILTLLLNSLTCLGVILSAVIPTDLGRHPYLVVLDSKTMNEVGRAEFEQVEFPKDLHGTFVSR